MLPLATTTVRVMKPSQAQESGEPTFSGNNAQLVVAARGVKAVIGRPIGIERHGVASTTYMLYCDFFNGELSNNDGIVDEVTGAKYEVSSVPFKRVGAGVDHWVAELNQVEGLRGQAI